MPNDVDTTTPIFLKPEQLFAGVLELNDRAEAIRRELNALGGSDGNLGFPSTQVGDSVRPALERLAEHIITLLNETSGDPDLEEETEGDGEADDEPTLGATEAVNQERSWSLRDNPSDRYSDEREAENEHGDELDKGEVCELELRGEADGEWGGNVDDEPSLGSLDARMSQLRWSQPDRSVAWPNQDLEHDDADHEGSIEDIPNHE